MTGKNIVTHKPKAVTIYRDEWGEESLRRTDGSMCCLGFLGLASGLCASDITSITMPEKVNYSDSPTQVKSITGWYNKKRKWFNLAARINDSGTGELREAKLRQLFHHHGIKLVFKNTRPSKRRRTK